MMKKRKLTIQDLGGLPLTKIEDQGRPSLRKFTEQENQRIAQELIAAKKRDDEKRMKPIRDIENELNQAAREHSEKLKKFFSGSLQTMAGFPIDIIPVDYVGDYPTASSVDSVADAAAQNAFKQPLASQGC